MCVKHLVYMKVQWASRGSVWFYITCAHVHTSHGKLGFMLPGTVISSVFFFFNLQSPGLVFHPYHCS